MEYQQVKLSVFELCWLEVEIECSLLDLHYYHVILWCKEADIF